jgi:hypothetical protein
LRHSCFKPRAPASRLSITSRSSNWPIATGRPLRAVQKSDTCSNDGYDYADLYTPDSIFIDKFSPDGATGRVYLIMLGVQGPGSITRDGGYEDVYVKTAAGWRIKSRTHVRTRAWHNPLLQTPDLN